MNSYFGRFFLVISLITGSIGLTFGQNGDQVISTGQQLNAIQVTVRFLTIAPDSRSGALGDAGVATSPDLNSQCWNPAKYPAPIPTILYFFIISSRTTYTFKEHGRPKKLSPKF